VAVCTFSAAGSRVPQHPQLRGVHSLQGAANEWEIFWKTYKINSAVITVMRYKEGEGKTILRRGHKVTKPGTAYTFTQRTPSLILADTGIICILYRCQRESDSEFAA